MAKPSAVTGDDMTIGNCSAIRTLHIMRIVNTVKSISVSDWKEAKARKWENSGILKNIKIHVYVSSGGWKLSVKTMANKPVGKWRLPVYRATCIDIWCMQQRPLSVLIRKVIFVSVGGILCTNRPAVYFLLRNSWNGKFILNKVNVIEIRHLLDVQNPLFAISKLKHIYQRAKSFDYKSGFFFRFDVVIELKV